jgi:hypothetical protein
MGLPVIVPALICVCCSSEPSRSLQIQITLISDGFVMFSRSMRSDADGK